MLGLAAIDCSVARVTVSRLGSPSTNGVGQGSPVGDDRVHSGLRGEPWSESARMHGEPSLAPASNACGASPGFLVLPFRGSTHVEQCGKDRYRDAVWPP
jgi:hypothetical protein